MRVLHLTDRLSSRGGADWHLVGVLRSMREEHELILAVGRDDGSVESPCPVEIVEPLAARERQPVALDELRRRFNPDVIHVHNVVNPAALEWAAAANAVMTVQDHRSFCPGRGKLTLDGEVCSEPLSDSLCSQCFDDEGYFRDIMQLTRERLEALRRMAYVTVLSNYMCAELGSVGVERVAVIPPFVHGLERSAKADGSPCILFVGRMVAAKGVEDAIAAWKLASQPLPLLFAGTGPLRQLASQQGCEVLGWLSHQQLARAYARASVVVLPSRWQEPFGIVGLEALTMGKPVAAYDSGGVRDWHPSTGLRTSPTGLRTSPPGLVGWGDTQALSGALVELCGQTASAPDGFERDALTGRLLEVYRYL